MIHTVIFDIDNTLYSYDDAHCIAFQALCRYAQRELGLAPERFQALYDEANRDMKRRVGKNAAIHNRLIRCQNLLEGLGLPLRHALAMSQLYWDTLIGAAVPSPGAVCAVRTMKERGRRIGVGTDMTARLQLKKLEKLGVLDEVDFVVSSEEVQAEKPSAALFARCIEKAQAPAEQCLFVGDNLERDVGGALSAGMQALWYCPKGAPEGTEVPFITSLEQLPAVEAQL